jgi:hypothetical protein
MVFEYRWITQVRTKAFLQQILLVEYVSVQNFSWTLFD